MIVQSVSGIVRKNKFHNYSSLPLPKVHPGFEIYGSLQRLQGSHELISSTVDPPLAAATQTHVLSCVAVCNEMLLKVCVI